MLQILIIIGWGLAVIFAVFLAAQAIKHRFSGPRRKKSTSRKTKLFKTRREAGMHAQETHPDRVVSHEVHEAHEAHHDYRIVMTLIGFVALFLWEAFWISEISDRFRWSANPFQLPYFFLLVVLVGIPLAVYLYARRMIRSSAPPSP